MKREKNKSVTCFGEILWDMLPSGKQPGGAPMNVAMHLNKFGVPVEMISRVGNDELGREILNYLKENKLKTDYVQIDGINNTGIVKVYLDDQKNATYDIVKPVAWDFIELEDPIVQLAKNSDYFVFGSLAGRSKTSNDTLIELIGYAKKKVFDINLRKPHFNKEKIAQILTLSDIVKLNNEEVEVLKGWFGSTGDTIDVICKNIKEKFSIETMIVTMGDKGALVYHEEHMFMNTGFKVTTRDTIGSGDSFLAAFLATYIEGKSIQECLEISCGTGSYVATCVGANPFYTKHDILEFIKEKKRMIKI